MTTTSEHPIIQVSGLTKTYDGVTVVDDLALSVNRGEVFGILGANGAGKTTTVECLQGLRRPDRGQVSVCGLDPYTQSSALAARMGSQLQESALPDRLKIGEALRLFATPDATPTVEILDIWGLTGHRKTAFANLSGGQQQRLFIALALQNKPDVVFLDELTQGLDPSARRVVWELITELRAGGTTVVLVTHFMDEAEALCDRVAVMNAGKIISVGTPEQLIDQFAHPMEISFTVPEGIDPNGLFDDLPGVEEISLRNGRLSLAGQRGIIAHIGAALVGTGTVPCDINTHQPSLEEALLPIIEATAS